MTYRKLHVRIEPNQSAVIPFRFRDGRVEVLLVTTRGKGKWIVPKGVIEEDQESHDSAQREAFEEAGVRGRVSPVSLGCYRHGKSKKAPVVEVFLMHVERELKSWPEKNERTRQWIPLEEAYGYVEEEGLRSLLDEASMLMQINASEEAGFQDLVSHPAIPDEAVSPGGE